MKAKFSSRKFTNAIILLVLLTAAIFAGSCRSNEVEIPPLTGPSGARLFIQIQANPDHLVIHEVGRPRETSDITIQLKNHLGQGVPGENLKLRILNQTLNEINIGRLSDFNVRTDSSGFARVIYTAPDTSELIDATTIIIRAVLTNAAYPDEVFDMHEIELQRSSVDPGDCAGDLIPQGDVEVSPSNPVVNETVCFDATDVFPTAEEFFWTFGNGDSAEGEVVCTTFDEDGTFTVNLLARSIDRDCGELTFNVVVGEGDPATCTITFSPTPVRVGQDVVFVATTDDPDGDVRRFNWNFGDGSTQNTNRGTVTHDYDEPGTYIVVLTITDDQGNVSTCQTTVTVTTEDVGDPTCAFTVSPTDAEPGTTITVNASLSDDADGEIVNYNVDFGDGTPPVDSPDPIITKPGGYAAPGDYTITLTVTDDDGNDAVCNVTFTVEDPDGGGAADCNDGVDNDGDGLVDDAQDPGCFSTADTSELDPNIECDDGADNDLDGDIDSDDAQCSDPTDDDESV